MGNKESSGSGSGSSSNFKLSKDEFEGYQRELNLQGDVLKKMIAQFAKMANSQGRVSKEAFKQTIGTYYGGTDGTLVRMIMTLFDRDNSQEIDFREFVLALSYASTTNVDNAIEIAFQCMDLNGDGGITKDELRAVFRTQKRLNKYVNVFKRSKPLDEIQLAPGDTIDCHDEADKVFDMIPKADEKQIKRDEFIFACNGNPALKQKISDLMIGASQSKMIFS